MGDVLNTHLARTACQPYDISVCRCDGGYIIPSRAIPATEGTLFWSKYITEYAKRDEKLNEEHLNAQIAQIQLARSITRISPASSARYAIESLAGTGFTRHVQFLGRVRQYAGEFRTFLVETDRADRESPHAIGPMEGTSQKPVSFIVKHIITWTSTEWRGYKPRQRRRGGCFLKCKHIFGLYYKSIPKFEDRIRLSGVYTAAATDILLLLLFSVVLFAGSFLSFLRIDV